MGLECTLLIGIEKPGLVLVRKVLPKALCQLRRASGHGGWLARVFGHRRVGIANGHAHNPGLCRELPVQAQ